MSPSMCRHAHCTYDVVPLKLIMLLPMTVCQVPAVVVEVQVTGSANIVTFAPYYPGCVPLQLVNHTDLSLPFRQLYAQRL